MLSEVLGDRLGVDVYPLAPADLNVFLDDERFTAHPPRTVIVECVERGVPDCLPEVPDTRRSGSPLRARLRQMRVVQRVAVRLDRAWKGTLRNYLRASFDRRVARVLGTRVEEAGGQPRMLFLHPAGLTEASDPAAAIAETIKRLKAFQRRLDRRGTRIVFLPIPEKENIHHGLLPSTGTAKPVFLARLITALRDAGIETVDTQTALDDAYRGDGRLLYHTDDTHWNGTGVRVVADAVAKVIGQRGGSGSAR
jgi:lysophospholipase L1-like esterase